MSDPNGNPVAAWYPDPQTPGLVRWWDGAQWTQHVSVPANPLQASQPAIQAAVSQAAVSQAAVPQAAVPQAAVPQIAEADAALAAADLEHAAADGWASIAAAAAQGASARTSAESEHIGRHAAGSEPVARQGPRAPRIRPRERAEVPGESLLSA